MTESELSEPDRKALAFVRSYVRRHRRAPSYVEVGTHLGLPHPNNAKRNCDRLVAAGFLARDSVGGGAPGRPRLLRLSDDSPRGFAKRVAGFVAAGTPIPPAPPEGEWLELERLFGADDMTILRVRGSSMVEAGILDGDYVAVRPCAKADTGRLVVAEIDGCHTLKVFRLLRGHPYLYPRNRKMQPIKLEPKDDPRLLGVYVGLVRVAGKPK